MFDENKNVCNTTCFSISLRQIVVIVNSFHLCCVKLAVVVMFVILRYEMSRKYQIAEL